MKKIIDENNIAINISSKLQHAIKQKATSEEIIEVLKEIPDEEGETQMNPLKVITKLTIDKGLVTS